MATCSLATRKRASSSDASAASPSKKRFDRWAPVSTADIVLTKSLSKEPAKMVAALKEYGYSEEEATRTQKALQKNNTNKIVGNWTRDKERRILTNKSCPTVTSKSSKSVEALGSLVKEYFLDEEGELAPNKAVCIPFRNVSFDESTKKRIQALNPNILFEKCCDNEAPNHLLGEYLMMELGGKIIGLQVLSYKHKGKVDLHFRFWILLPAARDGGLPIEAFRVKGRENDMSGTKTKTAKQAAPELPPGSEPEDDMESEAADPELVSDIAPVPMGQAPPGLANTWDWSQISMW